MATQIHACGRCGVPGHNRRTCPENTERPRALASPARPRLLAVEGKRYTDPRYHELPPAEAERLLATIRPIEKACAGEPLDSLLLSVYLRGMLDADLAREAGAAEAVSR
jgi:hypothetical protein